MLGFDVHVNDDDDGGDRDAKLAWWTRSDNAWRSPANLGTVEIAAAPERRVTLAPTRPGFYDAWAVRGTGTDDGAKASLTPENSRAMLSVAPDAAEIRVLNKADGTLAVFPAATAGKRARIVVSPADFLYVGVLRTQLTTEDGQPAAGPATLALAPGAPARAGTAIRTAPARDGQAEFTVVPIGRVRLTAFYKDAVNADRTRSVDVTVAPGPGGQPPTVTLTLPGAAPRTTEAAQPPRLPEAAATPPEPSSPLEIVGARGDAGPAGVPAPAPASLPAEPQGDPEWVPFALGGATVAAAFALAALLRAMLKRRTPVPPPLPDDPLAALPRGKQRRIGGARDDDARRGGDGASGLGAARRRRAAKPAAATRAAESGLHRPAARADAQLALGARRARGPGHGGDDRRRPHGPQTIGAAPGRRHGKRRGCGGGARWPRRRGARRGRAGRAAAVRRRR
jgi:hypothetical protein